ncbi:hypothetical protein PCYB_122050, partial [Plasmodium cynomolgi strain B]
MLHLIWFSSHNKYDECKITELKSLLHIFGYKDEGEALLNDTNKHKGEVFVKVNLPEDIDWKSVISRSVLIKGIIQIWSEGPTYDDGGHIVLDPFVGSGGLLITSSIFNAICVGNDIDIRLLKGYKIAYLNPHMQHKSRNKNIFENFLHYDLNRPEILVSDNSKPVWNAFHKPWVDAIVTDPPYGNRATVRICLRNDQAGDSAEGRTPANGATHPGGDNSDSSESADNRDRCDVSDKDGPGSSPQCDSVDRKRVKSLMSTKTVTYSCTAAVKDLLNIASITLVDNGMLVFLLPVQLDNLEEEIAILKHDDFFLISYDLQTFTPCSGRLIVSMQRKCRKPSN